MKTLLLKMGCIVAMLCPLLFSSCKEEDALPEITMEGKGTFGCLVNGKLWLPEGGGLGQGAAIADRSTYGFLSIGANNNNSGIRLTLKDSTGIKANSLYVFTNQPNYYGKYSIKINNSYCDYRYQNLVSGKLLITKLQSGVVSGTFEFTTYNPACGSDSIKVTEGRFDLM